MLCYAMLCYAMIVLCSCFLLLLGPAQVYADLFFFALNQYKILKNQNRDDPLFIHSGVFTIPFLWQGKGEFAMEYCRYLPASQQVQAELMDRFNVDRLKKAKSR